MTTNGRRDNIVLDTERQRSLDLLRDGKGDKLDVVIVSLWQTADLLSAGIQRNDDYHTSKGMRGNLKAHGPHWGVGAGGAGILIALAEAAGRIFGR